MKASPLYLSVAVAFALSLLWVLSILPSATAASNWRGLSSLASLLVGPAAPQRSLVADPAAGGAADADSEPETNAGREQHVTRWVAAEAGEERPAHPVLRAPLSFLATEVRQSRTRGHRTGSDDGPKSEEAFGVEGGEERGSSEDQLDSHDGALLADPPASLSFLQQTPTTTTTVPVSVLRGRVCTALGGLYSPALNVCCQASCGTCGGTGCETRPGGFAGCCSGGITRARRVCSRDPAPCIPDTDAIVATRNFTSPAQFCAWRGGIFSPWGRSCCPATCGVCGGSTCTAAPGGYNSCCAGGVQTRGSCVFNAPPCVVDVVPTGIPARVSRPFSAYDSRPCMEGFCNHLGGALSRDGMFCCPAGCGTCGGAPPNQAGCAARPLGAAMCCPQAAMVARCVLGGTLPCLADAIPSCVV